MKARVFWACLVAVTAGMALLHAMPTPGTTASFSDVEVMQGNTFRAFGPGPAGLGLKPGTSKATYVSGGHAPFPLIARRSHGSLDLDFGEVTFGNSNMSPDVFRICNDMNASRTFAVVVSPLIQDLFRDVAIDGGGSVGPGSEASVRMAINGGARPPGAYEGTIVVRDIQGEFFRIIRVTFRILGTRQSAMLASQSASVDASDAPTADLEQGVPVTDPADPAVESGSETPPPAADGSGPAPDAVGTGAGEPAAPTVAPPPSGDATPGAG